MNRFFHYAAGAAVLLGSSFGLTACDFTEGNDQDPNAVTDVGPELLLPAGQLGQILIQEGDFARISGMFAAQFTGSDRQYLRIDNANLTTDDFSNTWNALYQDALAQLDLAEGKFEEQGNRVGAGVARLHKAYAYGTATALFGDIPFSQALNPEFENPVFDPQADVYAGVISLLQSAITDLESGVGVASGDVFGLTSEQYTEVAYTLLARYNLHVGNYAAAEAAAEDGISTAANNLVVPHGDAIDSNGNLYWAFVADYRGGYLTANDAFAVSLLEDRDDPRIDVFYDAPSVAAAELNTDDTTPTIFGLSSDFPLVTYRENQLILAEARLLSDGDADGALDALNDVRALNEADFGDGEGDAEFPEFESDDFDSDNDLLEEILTEKYISLIGQIEAYNDVRRTDNFIGIPGKNNGNVPQRFLYARSELNANSNAPALASVGDATPVNASINYTGL